MEKWFFVPTIQSVLFIGIQYRDPWVIAESFMDTDTREYYKAYIYRSISYLISGRQSDLKKL